MPNKVKAIHDIATPTTRRKLRSFIGIINYYCDMQVHRSDLLAPLSRLSSFTIKWKWTEVEQKAFENIKKIISKEALVSFPDFSKPFEIHIDASHTQLGAVVSQGNKPIGFYSRKLNSAQTRYTTTERELLSIVEALKNLETSCWVNRSQLYRPSKFNLSKIQY